MTREEHLVFCKICTNRKFDKRKGIVCSLTNDIAAFEVECNDFQKDEAAEDVLIMTADDEDFLMSKDIKSKISDEQYQQLIDEQNLPAAIISGIGVAIVGVVLWAIISALTGLQFGILAVGIGAAIGIAMRYFGKGIQPIFGIIGALLAILACLFGNFFGIVGFIANESGLSSLEVIEEFGISELSSILFSNWFGFMNILFYLAAAFAGFKFSMRKVTEKVIRTMNKNQ